MRKHGRVAPSARRCEGLTPSAEQTAIVFGTHLRSCVLQSRVRAELYQTRVVEVVSEALELARSMQTA